MKKTMQVGLYSLQPTTWGLFQRIDVSNISQNGFFCYQKKLTDYVQIFKPIIHERKLYFCNYLKFHLNTGSIIEIFESNIIKILFDSIIWQKLPPFH